MANRKIYETQFLMGAKVQASMGAAFGQVQRGMRGIERQAELSSRALRGVSGAMKTVIGAAAAYVSFGAFIDFTKQSVLAGQESILVETKLATVMRERMKATNAQIQQIIKLAAQQQKIGVIEDDAQVAGAQQLATFLNQANSLKVLIPAMNNLLAQQKGVNATAEDAVSVGNMMGKVFTGQVGALTKVGISFSKAQEKVLKYGNEQQKAAMLARVIDENVGQMNRQIALTGPGKLAQARNMLGDMQEEIGKKLIPVQIKMAENFLKILPYIERMLPLLDRIPPIVDKVAGGAEWVAQNWGTIKPVIEALTVAYMANRVAVLSVIAAQKAGMIITALTKAWGTATAVLALMREGYSLATIAQMQLNVAMAANPIGIVIVAITALTIGAYYLVKNWDKVRKFFVGLWNGPLNNKWIQKLLMIFLPFIGIPIMIIKNWDKVKAFFIGFWGVITQAWKAIWGLLDNQWAQKALALVMPFIGIPIMIIKNWDKVKAAFGAIGGFIGNVFKAMVGQVKANINMLITILNYLIGAMNKIKFKAPKWVPKIGGKSVAVNIPKIPMLARGTRNFQGGLAVVGERGRELANLPRGSSVTPNGKTERLLNGLSNVGRGINLTWAPQYHVAGNADKETLQEVNRQSFNDFRREFDKMMDNKNRLALA